MSSCFCFADYSQYPQPNTAYSQFRQLTSVTVCCSIILIAGNLMSQLLIMPRTFVTFVPDVNNKWEVRSLEKHKA